MKFVTRIETEFHRNEFLNKYFDKFRLTRIYIDDDLTNGDRKGVGVLETDPSSNGGLRVDAIVLAGAPVKQRRFIHISLDAIDGIHF